jgi:hypothetical protein
MGPRPDSSHGRRTPPSSGRSRSRPVPAPDIISGARSHVREHVALGGGHCSCDTWVDSEWTRIIGFTRASARRCGCVSAPRKRRGARTRSAARTLRLCGMVLLRSGHHRSTGTRAHVVCGNCRGPSGGGTSCRSRADGSYGSPPAVCQRASARVAGTISVPPGRSALNNTERPSSERTVFRVRSARSHAHHRSPTVHRDADDSAIDHVRRGCDHATRRTRDHHVSDESILSRTHARDVP